MSSIRTISLFLLFIEACLLGILSFFGFLFCSAYFFICLFKIFQFGMLLQNQKVFAELFLVVMIVLALISGWRILSWVLAEELLKGIRISRWWWVFASIGAISSILSLHFRPFKEVLDRFVDFPDDMILSQGNFFVPTFIHMILEVLRQKVVFRLNIR